MAAAQPGPSNGGAALTRSAAARQLTPPLCPRPGGLHPAILSC
jgi:hypothetical protein